ncbi:hypothetical protein BGX30_006300 [Mortierella sp. GBA39]|nr:hypothetical protein BGX30_006300 [Mortierella sp. GBA39]
MLLPYGQHLPKIHPSVYVAEGAKIVGDVQIGQQSSVWFNAVLRGDMAPIVIGDRCNIQDGVVGHVNTDEPLILEDDVSVGHAAIVHGCTIGKATYEVMLGLAAEMVWDEALRKHRSEELYREIDRALASGDEAAFRNLTDELKLLN